MCNSYGLKFITSCKHEAMGSLPLTKIRAIRLLVASIHRVLKGFTLPLLNQESSGVVTKQQSQRFPLDNLGLINGSHHTRIHLSNTPVRD